MWNKENPVDAYYCVGKLSAIPTPNNLVMVVAFKDFWDQNHYLYDDYLGPIEDALAQFQYYELSESYFEVNDPNFTHTKFVAQMKSLGYNMIYNEAMMPCVMETS